MAHGRAPIDCITTFSADLGGERVAPQRLMTHPRVGPVTALAMVLTLGPAERLASGEQVTSYFGLIPGEHSSGGGQRLVHISKQGRSFLRSCLLESRQHR